jgi:hypothetical protein
MARRRPICSSKLHVGPKYIGDDAARLVFDRAAVLAVSRPVSSSALAYIDAYADRALSDAPATTTSLAWSPLRFAAA